eukprot:361840-Chlamydomonas_euryale.AAC.15
MHTAQEDADVVSAMSQIVEEERTTSSTAEIDVSGAHAKGDKFQGTLEDAVLRNTNQFHKWHSELEAACALEMEEKYKRYADLLNSHWSSCDAILNQVGWHLQGLRMSMQHVQGCNHVHACELPSYTKTFI